MARVGLLTMNQLDFFVSDDETVVPELEKAGFTVDWIPWKSKAVDWNKYDLVIIRSTWDYQNHPEEFLAVLAKIEGSSARLANPLSIVQWNSEKSYLLKLEQEGVIIVPSIQLKSPTIGHIEDAFLKFDCQELVIKPLIGATAFDTFRIPVKSNFEFLNEILSHFENRSCLVQPFLPHIMSEGEFSLIYFNGNFSHALLKTPKKGDYRVQEEYGGEILGIEASSTMRACADFILSKIQTPLLYARVDLVRWKDGFALMELELIEPALYFRTAPDAKRNFVVAIKDWMSRS